MVWNLFKVNNKDTRTTSKRRSGIFIVTKGWLIYIWRPWKLSNFQDSPPLLVHRPYSSTPLTLDVQFQTNPLLTPSLQMIANQLKENIIQGWLFMLSGPSFRSAFIFSINSLILSGFPLTSFLLAEASLSAFSWLHALVCAVSQKYHEMSFIYNYSHFYCSFRNQSVLFAQFESVNKLWNNNRTVQVNERNWNKAKKQVT